MTELVRAHQENCFEAIWTSLGGRFPSALVKEAFFKVPRHLFVERYCSQGNPKMREVTPETLDEHLPAIYANGGLGIHYEPEDLGDGSLGPTAGEFDRAVFTAGAADLPARFFTQVEKELPRWPQTNHRARSVNGLNERLSRSRLRIGASTCALTSGWSSRASRSSSNPMAGNRLESGEVTHSRW